MRPVGHSAGRGGPERGGASKPALYFLDAWTIQRGVMPAHWGGVFVVLESCLAAASPRTWDCGASAMLAMPCGRVISRHLDAFTADDPIAPCGARRCIVRSSRRADRRARRPGETERT